MRFQATGGACYGKRLEPMSREGDAGRPAQHTISRPKKYLHKMM